MDLKYYLPEIYEDVIDFKELIESEQVEINDLWLSVANTLKETFTDDMGIEGITRWENILNIVTSQSQTESDRRNIIKTKLYVKNKLNFDFLNSVVSAYGTVYSIELNPATSTVVIKFRDLTDLADVQTKVREMVPAHLLIDMSYYYLLISQVEQLTITQMQSKNLEEFSPFVAQS